MMTEDKLINGIKAGLIGCVVKDILTALLEIFKLKPTYWDYGEYLVFQNINISMETLIAGIFMQVLFGVILAVAYTHLKHLIQTNHPLLRGFIFGIMIWFTSRILITMGHITALIPETDLIIPINALIAGLYGLTVALVLEKVENYKDRNG